MCVGRDTVIFNNMVKEGLSIMATFEQKVEKSQGVSYEDFNRNGVSGKVTNKI